MLENVDSVSQSIDGKSYYPQLEKWWPDISACEIIAKTHSKKQALEKEKKKDGILIHNNLSVTLNGCNMHVGPQFPTVLLQLTTTE